MSAGGSVDASVKDGVGIIVGVLVRTGDDGVGVFAGMGVRVKSWVAGYVKSMPFSKMTFALWVT